MLGVGGNSNEEYLLPRDSFLLSLVAFYFTFPKQLGMEGKAEGFVCMGAKAASSEGHGVAAELGIETQLSSRAAFLWVTVGTELLLQYRIREEFVET